MGVPRDKREGKLRWSNDRCASAWRLTPILARTQLRALKAELRALVPDIHAVVDRAHQACARQKERVGPVSRVLGGGGGEVRLGDGGGVIRRAHRPSNGRTSGLRCTGLHPCAVWIRDSAAVTVCAAKVKSMQHRERHRALIRCFCGDRDDMIPSGTCDCFHHSVLASCATAQ